MLYGVFLTSLPMTECSLATFISQKTPGMDSTPVELLKEGDDTVLGRMHRICVALCKTEKWPEDWADSIFIPLLKKGNL